MTLDKIIAVFCRVFDVSESDLLGHSRKRPICLIRQAAMAIAAEQLSPAVTLAEIGQRFARHHSTVIHARELARHDPAIQKLVVKALPHITNTNDIGFGGWLENEISIGGYIQTGLPHHVTYR